jgi:hypothetical protein
MALTYDGSNGLFTRLGKLFGLAEAVRAHQSDVKTRIAAIQAEYSSADAYMLGDLVGRMESRIAAAGLIVSDVEDAAVQTLIEMCYADAGVSTRSVMPSKDQRSALLYLIREMGLDIESVDGTTVTKASVSVGSGNTGNGTLLFTELPPLALASGVIQFPNIRTERVEIRCIADAQSKEIPSGSELFEVRGQTAFDNLDYRFPAGSGAAYVMPCLNPSLDTGVRYGNLLRNSAFTTYATTANLPDYWATVTGTPGTHFAQEASVTYRGGSAFKMIGDGATLAKIRQQFNSETGTGNTIGSDRLYVLAVAARVNASASSGTVRVSLQDGSGTVVTGATLSITTGVGTTYAWQSVFFRAPLALPSAVYAAVEQTVAINSGGIMYLDELVLAEVRQLAPGGQGVVVLPGSTDWAVNDHLRLVSTNNAEGEFNTEFDRFFDMYGKGLLLPANTAGSETILDSLIS